MGSKSRGDADDNADEDKREQRSRRRRRLEGEPVAPAEVRDDDQHGADVELHRRDIAPAQVQQQQQQQQDNESRPVYDQNRNLNLEDIAKELGSDQFESQHQQDEARAGAERRRRNHLDQQRSPTKRGSLLDDHQLARHEQRNIIVGQRCSSTSPEVSESLSSSSATASTINGSSDDCSSRSTGRLQANPAAAQHDGDCRTTSARQAAADDQSEARTGTTTTTTTTTAGNEYDRLLCYEPGGGGKAEFELLPAQRGHNGLVVIPIQDQPAAADDKPSANGGGGGGFINQLGRRMSALPQLLTRRMSGLKEEELARRLSLQHSRSVVSASSATTGTNTSGTTGGSPAAAIVIHHQQQAAAPPLTAVAGVGGTITTVTRSKRKTAPLPRLVGKNGQVNLFLDNIDRRQYVRDLFTTMIDIKWRYNLMAAAFGFVFSWLLFACVWYLVLYFHQDLEHENDPNWSPCIVNVYSFPAALLFSIETQSTLGFGSRIISVECPGAIVIFCIQLIFGVVVECLIVGMVFAKLSRPAKRSQTIMYSKYATICLRESRMCLMFRVGDVRSKSHIIGATIRASLVSQKITSEGETIPFYHHQLKVRIDDSRNSLLLIWPVTVVHIIDESSPFYKLNSEQLASFKFEIITVLEGTVESTGQSIQVRSSYLPSEVKWGYRFEPIVSTHGFGRCAQTIIDYNKFNHIVRVDTPDCSALDYYLKREEQHQHQQRQLDQEPLETLAERDEIESENSFPSEALAVI